MNHQGGTIVRRAKRYKLISTEAPLLQAFFQRQPFSKTFSQQPNIDFRLNHSIWFKRFYRKPQFTILTPSTATIRACSRLRAKILTSWHQDTKTSIIRLQSHHQPFRDCRPHFDMRCQAYYCDKQHFISADE